ncbi:MAG: transcriptional repressor [Planctomycetes bacterium]|nr:transcriptional repressor [Planctomycetota bacterium]
MKSRTKTTEANTWRDRIRRAGLRSTPARVAILEYLQTTSRPVTHAQAAADLESRGFDQATIYRSLVEMAEAGLLTRMELGDRVWRYEVRSATTSDQPAHLHFLCVACGKIECLDGTSVESALAPAIRRATGGTIDEVLLKGHCRACK